ncbi:MAG: hypothetical protein LBP54_04200 [Campylobacteraceae bacterium]|jgi:hypothetical protein|nr:hypothetical protein [Campylobacteraceae bacterium]
MELMFCGSIPKNYDRPYENEDYYNIDIINQTLRVAVSDGATVSYDSKHWAKNLADCFVEKGFVLNRDINRLVKLYYSNRFDFKNLTLFQKRGLRFGSYATILGLEYNPISNFIQILSIGDSIAVFLDNYEFVDSFPYSKSSDFKKNPKLLSAKKKHNYFFSRSKDYSKFYRVWNLEKVYCPIVLCMTDALAEWAFKSYESGNMDTWREIGSINSMKDFKSFVDSKRLEKSIKIDDTTLICMKF